MQTQMYLMLLGEHYAAVVDNMQLTWWRSIAQHNCMCEEEFSFSLAIINDCVDAANLLMKRSATLSHWKNSLNWTTLLLARMPPTMLQLVYVRIATVSHTSPSLNLGTSLIPHCCGLLCQTESNKSSVISTKMLENEDYKCMKYIWCSSMKLDRTGSSV